MPGSGSGVSGVSGTAVAATAAGALLIWSGLKGASVSQALRSVLSGKKPSAANVNPISGAAEPGIPGGLGSLGSGSGASIAADALQYQGAGYVWGGAPANGSGNWDCSSFCNWVIGHDEGLAIPGYGAGKYNGSVHGPTTLVWLAWAGCTTVGHDGAVAQAGDLAIWQTHMGICTGPNEMISAQNPQSGTAVSPINGFIPELLFIRRLDAVAAGRSETLPDIVAHLKGEGA